MDYLKQTLESATEAIISCVTSWNFIAYIVVNIICFLIVKYYGLRDIRRGNADPKVLKNYWAFTRGDISSLHVIWCLPFYATFLPRFIVTIIFVMIAGMTGDLLLVSKEDAKNTTQKGLRDFRHRIIKFTI